MAIITETFTVPHQRTHQATAEWIQHHLARELTRGPAQLTGADTMIYTLATGASVTVRDVAGQLVMMPQGFADTPGVALTRTSPETARIRTAVLRATRAHDRIQANLTARATRRDETTAQTT